MPEPVATTIIGKTTLTVSWWVLLIGIKTLVKRFGGPDDSATATQAASWLKDILEPLGDIAPNVGASQLEQIWKQGGISATPEQNHHLRRAFVVAIRNVLAERDLRPGLREASGTTDAVFDFLVEWLDATLTRAFADSAILDTLFPSIPGDALAALHSRELLPAGPSLAPLLIPFYDTALAPLVDGFAISSVDREKVRLATIRGLTAHFPRAFTEALKRVEGAMESYSRLMFGEIHRLCETLPEINAQLGELASQVVQLREDLPGVTGVFAENLLAQLNGRSDGAAVLHEEMIGIGDLFTREVQAAINQINQKTEDEGKKTRVYIDHYLKAQIDPDPVPLPTRPPDGELELLHAKYRVIPVVGREGDMAAVLAWLDDPGPFGLRVLTGPAGAGKTRFAIELFDRLTSFGCWAAGFLRPVKLNEFLRKHSASELVWEEPSLWVIDYAAAQVENLRSLLEGVLDTIEHRENCPPLRIVLLERHAAMDTGWLGNLRTVPGIDGYISPPHRLAPVVSVALRREIFTAFLARAAEFMGGVAQDVPAPGADPLFDAHLADARWNDPLLIELAALVARERGISQALSLSRRQLVERFSLRERARLDRHLQHVGGQNLVSTHGTAVAHLVAAVTLAGGTPGRSLMGEGGTRQLRILVVWRRSCSRRIAGAFLGPYRRWTPRAPSARSHRRILCSLLSPGASRGRPPASLRISRTGCLFCGLALLPGLCRPSQA
ncbi:MAG TPA: hypothetical protein VIT91_14775 [Chthoniobacterales bacterium]